MNKLFPEILCVCHIKAFPTVLETAKYGTQSCVLQEVIWRDLANEVQETQFSPVEVKVTIWQDAKSEKTYLNRSLR